MDSLRSKLTSLLPPSTKRSVMPKSILRTNSAIKVKELKVKQGVTEDETDPEILETLQRKKELRKAWVVVFGFYIMFVESGVRQIMNVFAKPVKEHFDCTQHVADIAVVVIPNAVGLFSGPVVAILYNMFGARVGITSGGLLCAVAYIAASFTTSIYRMFLYSLMIGVGCGLMRTAIMSVQCEYFTKKRIMIVLSIINIGPGIGLFIFPRILVPVMQWYSWQAGWRFIAGLFLVSALMGCFITRGPSKKHQSISAIFGTKVFTNGGFVFHQFASFCSAATCIVYVSHTLTWMRSHNVQEPEMIYSLNGIASIIGRVAMTVALEFNLHVGVLMVIGYVSGQAALCLAGFCSDSISFGFLNFFIGMGFGMYQASLGSYLLVLVGKDMMPNAFGYTNLFNGVAAMSSVNISNWLVSLSDSLLAEFVYIAVVAFLSCTFSVISFMFFRKQLQQKRKEKQERLNSKQVSMKVKIEPELVMATQADLEAAQPLREAILDYAAVCDQGDEEATYEHVSDISDNEDAEKATSERTASLHTANEE